MAVKVLDASAVAAMIFQEGDYQKIVERLQGHHLIAPTLLRQELANVALKKVKKHKLPTGDVQMALYHLTEWNVQWYGVPASKSFEAAQVTGLSAYDSTYAWLAWENEAELVTLDKHLDKAVNK